MQTTHTIFIALGLAGVLVVAAGTQDSVTVPKRIFVNHPGFLSEEPQPFTILQMQDQQGHPSGYSMSIDSVICLQGQCRTIRITMVWDALGDYQYYRLPEGQALEKRITTDSDRRLSMETWKYGAVPFTDADYKRLDQILKDKDSILRTLSLSAMSISPHSDTVDGVTEATPRAINMAVVEGASLTSFHLWHWANGEVVEAIRQLTHASCSESLLRAFLRSEKPHYVLFALEHLRIHKLFSPSRAAEVIEVASHGDEKRIELAVAYLREAMPDRAHYYDSLTKLFIASSAAGRIRLLTLMGAETTLTGAFFDTICVGLENMHTYQELNLFLRLAETHAYTSKPMLTRVSHFLESENFVLARRAYEYLEKQALDDQTRDLVQAFRQKAIRDGRVL